ncbi:hypothetical protein [Cereibacter sediminicola]|uniref:hypothetical protein n=1 Tax=Cereibacter sediminicola TaxID=2584941 RepID=UPI00164235B8|nr:hypothetical protein [Cereibacter sediminicola]
MLLHITTATGGPDSVFPVVERRRIRFPTLHMTTGNVSRKKWPCLESVLVRL